MQGTGVSSGNVSVCVFYDGDDDDAAAVFCVG